MRERARTMLAASALALAGCELLAGTGDPHLAGAADAALVDAGPPALFAELAGNAKGSLHVTSDPEGINCPDDCELGPLSEPTTYTLTATVTGGAFGGWRGVPGCTSDPVCVLEVKDTTRLRAFAFRDVRIAFVTSSLVRAGLLGSRAAADAECNSRAADAVLPHVGDYVAWLAGADGAPVLPQGSSWVRPDGQVFAEDSVTLLRSANVLYPLRLDEHGNDVGADAPVITDLITAGKPRAGSTRCGEYAGGTTGRIGTGVAGGGSRLWTEADTLGCGEPARLYCFDAHSQAATTATVPSRLGEDRVVFVSNRTFTPGGSGLPAADAICKADALIRFPPEIEFVALLAGDQNPAVARIGDGEHRWLRLDDVVVFENRADLLAGRMGAAIDFTPNRLYVGVEANPEVWLGAPSLTGTGFKNCGNWTSSEASASGQRTHASSSSGRATGETSCDLGKRLYCIQK